MAACLVGVTPASAAPPVTVTNWGSDSAVATVELVDGVHRIRVRDNHADNHSAVGLYKIGNAASWTPVWASGGAGTEEIRSFGLLAGQTVTFAACLGEAGEQVMWDTCRDNEGRYVNAPPGQADSPASHCCSPAAVSGPDAVPLAASFSAMTWNIEARLDEPDSVEQWARKITTDQPHVVGLQEMCQADVEEMLLVLNGRYNVRWGVAEPDKDWCDDWGNALLVRNDVTIGGSGKEFYANNGADPRVYQWADVAVGGEWIRVFNTHLEANDPGIRDLQVEELAVATKVAARALVVGDLNTWPNQENADSDGLSMDPLYDAGFRDADRDCNRWVNDNCVPTFHTDRPFEGKKDWVLMRGLGETAKEYVQPTTWSDHDPLFATMLMSTADWTTATGWLNNYGSDVAQVSFNPSTRRLSIKDNNVNGLSAVGVYWLEAENWFQHIEFNPNGADQPPKAVQLSMASGQRVMYMACSGYWTPNPPLVFWDTCGDKRLNTAS